MKLTDVQQKEFWKMAQCWAGSTLDTPKRAALLIEHVEGLMESALCRITSNDILVNVASPAQGDAGRWNAPPEGILHHALREQQEREQAAAARAAADALKNIDEFQARLSARRMEADQRTGVDRRKQRGNSCPCDPMGCMDGSSCPDAAGYTLCSDPAPTPRSEDMAQVASVMQPQIKECIG